jgi:hypothetical protein
MVKKRGVKKKPSKKNIKKSILRRSSFKMDSFIFKRRKVEINLIKFLVLFVIFLVLYALNHNYFGNYLLRILFGIGAIIGGAVSFGLILLWIALAISKKKK